MEPPVRKPHESDRDSIKRSSIDKKELLPEERKKLEYMACLDLVTPDTLKGKNSLDFTPNRLYRCIVMLMLMYGLSFIAPICQRD